MPLAMTSESEQASIRLASQGNADALGALFDLHSREVYRLAYRIVGSRDDAEDTVQDVFVGLPRALNRYTPTDSFLPWLRRVTVRTALMRLRAMRRTTKRHEKVAARPAATHDDELRITLDDALDTLPTPLREVTVLRLVAGYTHEEIATTLDITVPASKVRLHRALKHLRNILSDSL